jgi:hypothetical protein
MRQESPSQTILLGLDLRVYSMPLEKIKKSCPPRAGKKKNLLNATETSKTRW